MLISNQLFTDPCGSNIPKHFEIHYRCINRGKRERERERKLLFDEMIFLEEICTKLFVNCSKSKDLQCIKNIQEEFACPCPSTICRYGRISMHFINPIELSLRSL